MTEYDNPSADYHPLSESIKARYDFRTATTSFIYPDHILPNVRMLWPYVDEIELLFFESSPGSLPSADDIETLRKIREEKKISYNVHLPLDIDLCHPDPKTRQNGTDILSKVFDLARPLDPTTHTLHLPYTEDSSASTLKKWQQRACESLEKIFSGGIPAGRISIETLSYPPQWLDPILGTFDDLAMCLDIGHLIEHERNPAAVYDRFAERIAIIHLYGGVEKGRGHLPLNHLPETSIPDVSRILDDFDKTVCLEVFSYDHLCKSIDFLPHLIDSGNNNEVIGA